MDRTGLNVLVIFDSAGTPPADQNFKKAMEEEEDWKTENHVCAALKALGHRVRTLGVFDDIRLILKAAAKEKPDILFNLTEHFHDRSYYDRNVAGLFELLQIPYTGSGPAGLMLCRNKGIAKKILCHHHIQTPLFRVYPKGHPIAPPPKLKYPILVKPLREEASYGISQNSLVDREAALVERVRFIHDTFKQDAIAEEYVEGRELYVSILGNRRLRAFPVREMVFENIPEADRKFATFKAKWDEKYRRRWGIKNRFAALKPELEKKIQAICKKVYRLLSIQGYGRVDLRLTPADDIVVLEANPNPFIAKDEDFARSARKGGMEYNRLIQKILQLGFHPR
ncbi:MAG: ATP-grasp domain-containing protein [Deltaproteobacteria bacterium]|nr:ATP-grasp domain-containing protein [Deltaproteobacteria bacterium]